MFDSATPNPTGSLSGPWFDLSGSGNVTGVKGRNSHLACRVKNLANQTVSCSLLVLGADMFFPNLQIVLLWRATRCGFSGFLAFLTNFRPKIAQKRQKPEVSYFSATRGGFSQK